MSAIIQEPKYKTIVFDLDGTVLNTLDDLHDSCNYALRCHDLPTLTREQVRDFLGYGIKNLMDQATGTDCPEDLNDRVFLTFKKHYALHSADKTQPYPGILDLLEALSRQGVELAVLSNKADFAVKALAERYFPVLFNVVVGNRCDVRLKPAPDALEAIMDQLGSRPEDTCLVGDSETDFLCAQAAGCDFIGCAWGYRGHRKLQELGAETICGDAYDLLKALAC